MVNRYEYDTYNSHHKVLANLQASNMDAPKNQNYSLKLAARCPVSECWPSCLHLSWTQRKTDAFQVLWDI